MRRDVYVHCKIQCLLFTKFFRVAYFWGFGLFHFYLNVLKNQSSESNNNTNNFRSLLELLSLFLNLWSFKEIYDIHFITQIENYSCTPLKVFTGYFRKKNMWKRHLSITNKREPRNNLELWNNRFTALK